MIGAQVRSLPTKFAIKLAESACLFVPEDEARDNDELWYDLRDRLVNFQKLALACDFETCMVSYFDIRDNLTEDQLNILKIIHENTKNWLMGHVAEIMLDNLERTSRTNNRDKKEIAEMFLDNFIKPGESENKNQDKKGLLVRFANLPENVEISEDN